MEPSIKPWFTGGPVSVSVCIDPSSANAADMEIPVQNAIDVWNGLAPTTGNQQPANVDLMQVLISAIRNGKLDVTPEKNSGWYDYQLHALETLLLPEKGLESDHLLLTAAYKKKLVESFKSILTQTRETHVKQLETGADTVSALPKEVDIYPLFPVE